MQVDAEMNVPAVATLASDPLARQTLHGKRQRHIISAQIRQMVNQDTSDWAADCGCSDDSFLCGNSDVGGHYGGDCDDGCYGRGADAWWW